MTRSSPKPPPPPAAPQAEARAGNGAVQHAVQSIRDMVERGVVVPGTRLVEPELAARLGVSRPSLREAFRRLEADGLVTTERYKGASVRQLDPQQLQESFEIRELLEGLAARRSAPQFSGKGAARTRLTALAKAMEKAVAEGEISDYARLNREFHLLVFESARSEQLNSLAMHVHPPAIFRILHQRLMGHRAMERSMAEHRILIQALLAGDGEKAESAMRRHVRSSMGGVAGALNASASMPTGRSVPKAGR